MNTQFPVKVEMCLHYYWMSGAKCKKKRKASVKCHSERKDCPDYEPSIALEPLKEGRDDNNE